MVGIATLQHTGLVGADVVTLDDVVAAVADADAFRGVAGNDVTVRCSVATDDVPIATGDVYAVVAVARRCHAVALEPDPVTDDGVVVGIDFDSVLGEVGDDEATNGASA